MVTLTAELTCVCDMSLPTLPPSQTTSHFSSVTGLQYPLTTVKDPPTYGCPKICLKKTNGKTKKTAYFESI